MDSNFDNNCGPLLAHVSHDASQEPYKAPELYLMADGSQVLARSDRGFLEALKALGDQEMREASLDRYMEIISERVMERLNVHVRHHRGVNAFVKDLKRHRLLAVYPVN